MLARLRSRLPSEERLYYVMLSWGCFTGLEDNRERHAQRSRMRNKFTQVARARCSDEIWGEGVLGAEGVSDTQQRW